MTGDRAPWVAWLIGACVVLGPIEALAAPSARLVYVRNADTQSCPDENAVRAAVSARLGYDPFFPSANETMFIEISKEKGGYRARVKLVDEKNNVRGTREIAEKGRSCSAMIDTLALSISIAIDPDRLTSPPPERAAENAPAPSAPPAPSPAPDPPAAPPPSAPASAEPTSSSGPAAAPTSTSRIELLVLPAAWVGTGPSLAFGGELGARLRWPRVSLGVEARGDLPASRNVKGVDVDMAFYGGKLIGCGHSSSSFFFLCAHGTLGAISATSNASAPRDASAVRFLLGASVGAEVPAGEVFRFVARLTGSFALDRQTIVLDDRNVFELSRFSGGLEVGGLVRF